MSDAQEQFPIVNGFNLSHGTLECRKLKDSKQFYREFLGLACVRHHEEAQLISSAGYPWAIVSVQAGEGVRVQGRENRWGVDISSPQEVDEARAAALAHKERYGIRQIDEIVEQDGGRSFSLQDCDGNWWEIEYRRPGYYEDLFRRGDKA